MTVYLKEIDGVLTPAPNVYTDENGIFPAFNQNIDLMLEKGFSAFDEGDYALYKIGAKSFVNGAFVDEPTFEYKLSQSISKKNTFQLQIEDLDKKRIRAGFEPSVKDETTGQTWLEYYTLQIQNIRTQIGEFLA